MPWYITDHAHTYDATTRDDLIGLGPDNYAYLNTQSDRETSVFVPSTVQSPPQLEDTNDDTSAPSTATTTPPAEDGDATPKRSASTQPAGQPDSKRARVSTPSDGNSAGGDIDEIDQPSSQHPQQPEHTLADDSTTSRAKSLPPTTNVPTISKRSASVPPADQPDPKKPKPSIPSDWIGNAGDRDSISLQHAQILSKRRALAPPLDQPDPKRAKVFIPADGRGGSSGFLPAPFADILSKRWALAQPVGQPTPRKTGVFVPSDGSGGSGGFDEIPSPLFLKVLLILRASTKAPGEISFLSEQVRKAGVGGSGKDKVGKGNVGTDKINKDKNKVDDDSDELEIISITPVAPVTPISDWKDPDAARFASAKKSKGKQSQQLKKQDTEASPSARKSAAKAGNARGKSVSQAVNLDEPEASDDEAEEEEDDDEGSEHEDPQVAKKKILQAEKNLSKVCRTCKIKANKEWKDKYDTMVSKMNSEHRTAIRTLKADGAAALKKAKATTDKDKKAAKAKADKAVEDIKDALEDKFDTMKGKLDGEIKTLKKNLTAEKGKVAELKSGLENAETLRKKIEKDAAEQVNKAETDYKANNTELKERWKQIKRESQAEIDQWKPAYSKTVKDNQRIIKELTQKVLEREQELERSEDDLRRVRTQRATEKNHHADALEKLDEARARVKALQGEKVELGRHNKAIKERALSDVARAEEETATARVNLQQQSNKVVDKQRELYLIRDAMRTHASLAEGRKAEIEALKRQLRDARAELEVAVGIDDMEMVEVGRGDVVEGEVGKGEGVRGEATETV
jgi:hypothetical protein